MKIYLLITEKMTAFDDFFQNISQNNSKHIRGENMKDFENELKKMDENIKKASDLKDFLQKNFDTPKARQAGENIKTENKKTKNANEENGDKIEIKYPKKKDEKTWGFNGVAGMDELKTELREHFIEPLKFKFLVKNLEKQKDKDEKKLELYKTLHEAYEKFKVGIPTGLLFYGPPGTGKTFITKKLAEELNAGMIQKSVGEFGSSYIHETSKNIKKFFTEAKKASEDEAIILFLDEIDSLVSKRTGQIDSNKAEEVSQFLQEFNALEDEAPNLIVIAATNRPDHLDSAILRSGRLDKKIYIGPPDFDARKELFQIYLERKERPTKQIDYEKLAELTDGYVASDIEHICDEVSRNASKNILELVGKIENELDIKNVKNTIQNSVITMKMLEKEIKETTSSIKYTDMSIYAKWNKLQ